MHRKKFNYAEWPRGLCIGGSYPVRIMGVLNLSPESFYKESVATNGWSVAKRVSGMVREGADVIDIGGASTAPYLKTDIPVKEELRRIMDALTVIHRLGSIVPQILYTPISVDTTSSVVAEAALEHGAKVINDVSGLKGDPRMAEAVRRHDAGLIIMAHQPSEKDCRTPLSALTEALRDSIRIAKAAGIPRERIVVDPGIGFFRRKGGGRGFSHQDQMEWYEWDMHVLDHLRELLDLYRPICVSVSRKSYLDKLPDAKSTKPDERLIASLEAARHAVEHGASLIRTHDVLATIRAVNAAEAYSNTAR